ncbi:MAG: hypothetical protein KDD51_05435 [Bdellovibrionales bacterium]|nr:hypothetical protein [Bdellovibrionales bacterium]
MSMRYIIRRENPSDLEEIRRVVTDLDAQLGEAGQDYRREVYHTIGPMRRVVFGFSTEKRDAGFTWRCHNVEIVAETEDDFRALATEYGAKDLSFLTAQPF